MQITWYGQASFGIESANGTRIVTDPYDPEKAGFKPFPDAADVVIKSSSNDDYHDNDHLVPKKEGADVIDAFPLALECGETTSHGITFKAIEAMEHPGHPYHGPDQNAMYRFMLDGIEIGHTGIWATTSRTIRWRFSKVSTFCSAMPVANRSFRWKN